MDEGLYRFLKYTAFAIAIVVLGWGLFDSFYSAREPGDAAYLAGNRLFEDENYDRALVEYENALEVDPQLTDSNPAPRVRPPKLLTTSEPSTKRSADSATGSYTSSYK